MILFIFRTRIKCRLLCTAQVFWKKPKKEIYREPPDEGSEKCYSQGKLIRLSQTISMLTGRSSLAFSPVGPGGWHQYVNRDHGTVASARFAATGVDRASESLVAFFKHISQGLEHGHSELAVDLRDQAGPLGWVRWLLKYFGLFWYMIKLQFLF